MELLRPDAADAYWAAGERHGPVEVRFVGRGPRAPRAEVLAAVGGGGLELAWCRQIHSDRAVRAVPGQCGEADALFTERTGLALSVATADCVPVVVAAPDRLAVVHAGWRGIAASIVAKTLARLDGAGPLTAWLGPAIGPCCYEVGPEVADRVVAVCGPDALTEGSEDGRGRPHLDLHHAVVCQLERGGVTEVRRLDVCTRCHPEVLSSYRRDGERAGRNLTFAWLTGVSGGHNT